MSSDNKQNDLIYHFRIEKKKSGILETMHIKFFNTSIPLIAWELSQQAPDYEPLILELSRKEI